MNGIGGSQLFSSLQESIAPASAGRLRSSDAPSVGVGQMISNESSETTRLSVSAGVLASMLSESDVRMDRVSDLQQSIGSGTYYVPASDVAGKMLSSPLN